jgi:putative tricarboxylic transport membrane protein
MDKKQLCIEAIMPIFFILVSIAVYVAGGSMGSEGVFPRMVAGVMFLSSIYILFNTLRTKEIAANFKGLNVSKVVITFAILIAYAVLLPVIGYVFATFCLCSFIMIALGYRKILNVIIFTILTVAVVFFIFKILLDVPLPMIFFDF